MYIQVAWMPLEGVISDSHPCPPSHTGIAKIPGACGGKGEEWATADLQHLVSKSFSPIFFFSLTVLSHVSSFLFVSLETHFHRKESAVTAVETVQNRENLDPRSCLPAMRGARAVRCARLFTPTRTEVDATWMQSWMQSWMQWIMKPTPSPLSHPSGFPDRAENATSYEKDRGRDSASMPPWHRQRSRGGAGTRGRFSCLVQYGHGLEMSTGLSNDIYNIYRMYHAYISSHLSSGDGFDIGCGMLLVSLSYRGTRSRYRSDNPLGVTTTSFEDVAKLLPGCLSNSILPVSTCYDIEFWRTRSHTCTHYRYRETSFDTFPYLLSPYLSRVLDRGSPV